MVSTRSSTRATTTDPPDPPDAPRSARPATPRRPQRKRPTTSSDASATPRTRTSARIAERRARARGADPCISLTDTESHEADIVFVSQTSQKAGRGGSRQVSRSGEGGRIGPKRGGAGHGLESDSVRGDEKMESADRPREASARAGMESAGIVDNGQFGALMSGVDDTAVESAPVRVSDPAADEYADGAKAIQSVEAMKGGEVNAASVLLPAPDDPAGCAKHPHAGGAMEGGALDTAPVPGPTPDEPKDSAEPPASVEAIEEGAVATAPVSGPASDEPEDCAKPPSSKGGMEGLPVENAPAPGPAFGERKDSAEPPASVEAIEEGAVASAPVSGPTSDEREDNAKPSRSIREMGGGAVENAPAEGPTSEEPADCAKNPPSVEGMEERAVTTALVSGPPSDKSVERERPPPSMRKMKGEAVETAQAPERTSQEPTDCGRPPPSAGEMKDGVVDTAPVPMTTSDEPTNCTKLPSVIPVMARTAVAYLPTPGSTFDEPKDCTTPPSTKAMEGGVVDIAPVPGSRSDESADRSKPPRLIRVTEGEGANTAPEPGSKSDVKEENAKSPPSTDAMEAGAAETASAPGLAIGEPTDYANPPPSLGSMGGGAVDTAPVPIPISSEPRERRLPPSDMVGVEKADEPAQPQLISDDTCSEAEQKENVNESKGVKDKGGVIASRLTSGRLTNSTGNDSKHTVVDVSKFAENPAAFLRRDSSISRQCRDVVSRSFCAQSKAEFGDEISQFDVAPRKRKEGLPPLGPLLVLDIGEHLDCDQLWEGIDMRNSLLLSHLEARISSLQGKKRRKKKQKKRNNMANISQKLEDGQWGGVLQMGASESEKGRTVAAKNVTMKLMNGKDAGDKVGTDEVAEPDVYGSSAKQPDAMRKQSVRFAPGTKDEATDEKPITDSIDDGFFNLADMELFANDAEQLARQGKLVASDDESDDSDLDDTNEIESDFNPNVAAFKNSRASQKIQKLRYSDFFDPPSANVSGSKASRVSKLLGVSDDDALDETEEETPLVASHSRMRRLIDAMEEENVGKKPWQLRGEVSGFSRPKDSLLDTSMDYDATLDPKSIMDDDRTETIEDLIRQRIVDGLFDDVIPPLPDDYDANKKKKASDLPEISQEKPTEGLAEVYEREFLSEKEKAKNESRVTEVRKAREEKTEIQETEEQREVWRLFDKLASKLDALSGLHFTPGPVKATEEMAVTGDIKALASEEALPEAVSEESLRTAREVYSVDKKKLTGDLEKTRRDRRAAHRRSKRGIKKANEAKIRAARLMEHANPALGEKRRAEEALRRRGKKIRVAQPDAKVLGPKVIKGPEQLGPSGRGR